MNSIFYKLLFLFCTISAASFGQKNTTNNGTDSLQSRIILIGDAGALVKGRPSVLNSIKKYFPLDNKTSVVFLGDNLYSTGLPDETFSGYNQIKAALDSQINLTKGTSSKAFMIPGNHDWANGASEGYENVVRQQQYVDHHGNKNMSFHPKDGCPGPIEVSISKDVVLVMMDSQWWLHQHEKPGIESDCDTKTQTDVIAELADILTKNYNKLVILATHHPFKSNGPHGGYFTLRQHIFPFTDVNKNYYIPLPIIGSIYPITRSVFGSHQDIIHPTYRNMVNQIMGVVKIHKNVIMVAGHEHNLQYIVDSSFNFIVSGSGCKTNRVSPGKRAEYAAEALGFATLDITKNKQTILNFYTLDEKKGDSILTSFTKSILDFKTLPELPVEDTVTPIALYKNSVLSPASNQYKKLSKIQRFTNGENYRKEWSEPVNFKVFNIRKEKGGLKITGIGGGHQTKSLKLVDKSGVAWSLRTIDKDPKVLIPESFRNTFIQTMLQDMISSSHPYAPLITSTLEKAAGIPATEREFFFVPDDPGLGYFRPLFGNKICMLERRDINGETDNKSTFKLIDKLQEDNNITVDQYAVLNARLLDILIGDWDRHFDQWKWAKGDTGKGKTYYPMPKDRDQAFFHSDGLLMKIANYKMPFLMGLTKELKPLNKVNVISKDFDRLFMNGISKQSWDSITTQFIANITEPVIHSALKKMPPEIYAIRGSTIDSSLVKRRSQLHLYSMNYYDFISKVITVMGSNENEIYKVKSAENGLVDVTGVSFKTKKMDSSFVTYHRTFDPSITKEIRIFGLNGDDKFVIDSSVNTTIAFRFIGGKGNDTFSISGESKAYLYDVNTENNFYSGTAKSYFRSDPAINAFSIHVYQYPVKSYPKINLGYNGDDGFLLGGGFTVRNFKFKRAPFANEHRVGSLFSLAQKAIQIRYNAIFNKVINYNYDILINSSIKTPNLTNFYGFGNETKIVSPREFYTVRYSIVEGEVLLRKSTESVFSTYIGPSIQHYWNDNKDNLNRVLENPSKIGLDSLNVYKKQTYAGLKAGIDINNIQNELYPTRGITWRSFAHYQKGIANTKNNLLRLQSDMIVYASLQIPAKVVGIIKLGGEKIFADSLQYYQAVTLGQENNLRGFSKSRFAGDAVFYGSLELRIKLFESRSYLLPGQFGMIVFNDIGRVWFKKEQSNRYHYSYGGGLYFVPFNTAIVSATLGKSESETIFNFSLGAKFNLTY